MEKWIGLLIFPAIAAFLALIIRRYQPEQALAISLIAGSILLVAVLAGASPVFGFLNRLFSETGLPMDYGERLFKALGISLLTQISADSCRDAGEGGMAAKAEFVGKIALLIIGLPLFEQILETSLDLIQGGVE